MPTQTGYSKNIDTAWNTELSRPGTGEEIYKALWGFPILLDTVLGKGDLVRAASRTAQEAQAKMNQQHLDTHGICMIAKLIMGKIEDNIENVESSVFVLTSTGDRQTQNHDNSHWTLFWEMVKFLCAYPMVHHTFTNAVDTFEINVLPLLMRRKERLLRSRMAEDTTPEPVRWADVVPDPPIHSLQQQWGEIMGSDPTAFAAVAGLKVDSALRQECEAIKGIKDLLNSVERRQKEHVAKTKMGLWMERSGRAGVTIWKPDL